MADIPSVNLNLESRYVKAQVRPGGWNSRLRSKIDGRTSSRSEGYIIDLLYNWFNGQPMPPPSDQAGQDRLKVSWNRIIDWNPQLERWRIEELKVDVTGKLTVTIKGDDE